MRHQVTISLTAILIIGLAACTSQGSIPTKMESAPPTAPIAALLGPTSTPKRTTPTQEPVPATATLRPLEPVTEDDWIRGSLDAKLSFLVYCDFQSPPCADLTQTIDDLLELRPGEIQFIFRLFPLLVLNDKAGLAAQLALSADDQGAFWEMHDRLFEQQEDWTALSPEEFVDWAVEASEELGLETTKVESDLSQGVYVEQAEEAFRAGVTSGLPGTPFLLLNGDWFRASPTLTNLEAAIRLELLADMQYQDPPELRIVPETLYLARIKLTSGEIVVQLFPESAPATVANFIFLARQGWFDGTVFHRVVPGAYVEGGDPTGTGFGGPGYFIRDEFDPGLSFDRPGRLAMANSGPDTNGSQFAITLRSMPQWEDTRTIFGQVIEGLTILSALEERAPIDDLLIEPQIKIINVTIEER